MALRRRQLDPKYVQRGVWFPLVALTVAFVFREVILGDDASRALEFVVWVVLAIAIYVVAFATGFLKVAWERVPEQ